MGFIKIYIINNLKTSIHKILPKDKEIYTEHFFYKEPPSWPKILLGIIVSSFGCGLLFASLTKIDEVVVTRGELQAIGAQKPIKSPISGVIDRVLIKEGDSVKKNHLLITFNTKSLNAKLESLIAKLNEKKSSLKAEKNILKELEILSSIGGIQKLQYLQQEKTVTELKYEIKQLQANIKEIEFNEDTTNLKSPVSGRVFNLKSISTGYAATLGETLLNIVPDGEVEAKIYISNRDIGFVKPNMEAEIRVDAFPFTQYGSIKGKVLSIGDEVLPPDQMNAITRFPAYVKLSDQKLIKGNEIYNLRSGYSITVNLIVRNKPIISLLSDPLKEAFDNLRGIKN